MEKAIFTLSLRKYACLLLLLASAIGINSVNAQNFIPIQDPGIAAGDLGPNILVNPSFEDNGLGPVIGTGGGNVVPGWFFFGGYGGFSNIFIEQGPGSFNNNNGDPVGLFASDGGQFVKNFGAFNDPFNVTGFAQDVPATPGTVYKAAIDIATPLNDAITGTDNFHELHIEFRDANGGLLVANNTFLYSSTEPFNGGDAAVDNAAGYQRKVTIAEAPAGTAYATVASLFFNVNWNGGAVYLDNASYQEVLPQGNIVVDLCPGETTADITVPVNEAAAFSGIASFTNDFNGAADASGTYPEGTTTVTYTATANGGQVSTYSFDVVVNPFVPVGGTITCNDHVNISIPMGGVAGVPVTADMILEGAAPNCIQNLDVNINGTGSNLIYCSDIGSTLTVMVTDIETGNSCWSTITVEDKLAPTCLNPGNTTISCSQDPDAVPASMFEDNCDIASVLLSSEIVTGDVCTGNKTITKTWVATDVHGNVSDPCTQVITVTREDIVFDNDFNIDCQIYANNPASTHPDATGYPFGGDADACGYAFTYVDEIDEDCGTSFNIARTWTVLDWCSGELVTEDIFGNDNIQIITITEYTHSHVALLVLSHSQK